MNSKSILHKIKQRGVRGVYDALVRRVAPPRFHCYPQFASLLAGTYGLEIGGPSPTFGVRGPFPLYLTAGSIDNCTFSNSTVWEGEVEEGAFQFARDKPPGKQFIIEAGNLSRLASQSYDFVASSHVLEHVANPLSALHEWIRVMKTGGYLVLILPHKDNTFDHARSVTSLEHIIEDFENRTGEDDMTHLDEILELHDLQLDPDSGDYEAFKARSLKNSENRCFHHHVFNTPSAIRLVDHVKLQLLAVEVANPYHILLIGQKTPEGVPADNRRFMSSGGVRSWTSPFPSDRVN